MNGRTFIHWQVNVAAHEMRESPAGAGHDPHHRTTTGTAFYVATTADGDGDGLSDWYEWIYAGSTNAVTGPGRYYDEGYWLTTWDTSPLSR
ncbi:MAG: hypothetical protein U1F87_18435 [Kiritimatiellia bacterium]